MIIKALIIASEITKGMKSIGPRSMLDINKKNKIIDQQIASIKSMYRNTEITIACGFEYEKVKNYINKRYKNIKIIHNKEYDKTNESKNIELFLDQCDTQEIDYLFIINGGVLLRKKSISFSKIKGSSKIFLIKSLKKNFNLGCSQKDNIEYIFYDLEIPWLECVLLNQTTIRKIEKYLSSSGTDNMYTFELLNNILTDDSIEAVYLHKNNAIKITNISEINKAKSFVS